MSDWTRDELSRIDHAEELELASEKRDGSLRNPVTMWVVRDGDELFVRSIHGTAGGWFRGTQALRQGHIRSGGVERDVAFVVDTDTLLNDRIDDAYRSKYHRYGDKMVGTVVNPGAREATIKLVPR
jgi:hypothetical protein